MNKYTIMKYTHKDVCSKPEVTEYRVYTLVVTGYLWWKKSRWVEIGREYTAKASRELIRNHKGQTTEPGEVTGVCECVYSE